VYERGERKIMCVATNWLHLIENLTILRRAKVSLKRE
jgi:hypothetical protein